MFSLLSSPSLFFTGFCQLLSHSVLKQRNYENRNVRFFSRRFNFRRNACFNKNRELKTTQSVSNTHIMLVYERFLKRYTAKNNSHVDIYIPGSANVMKMHWSINGYAN